MESRTASKADAGVFAASPRHPTSQTTRRKDRSGGRSRHPRRARTLSEIRREMETERKAAKEEFLSAPKALRNDRAFVLESVRRHNGRVLRYVPEVFRRDREVLLEAVTSDAHNFLAAPKELRNDRAYVLEAVRRNGRVLYKVPEAFRRDREIVLEAVRRDRLPQPIVEHFRSDREIITEAIKRDWSVLDLIAPEDIPDDREMGLEAVKQNAKVLMNSHFREKFCEDREIMAEAAKQQFWEEDALYFASANLRNDHEFVLGMVRRSGRALIHASKELRGDRQVVLEAVKQNWCALRCASEELRNDREFVLGMLRWSGRALIYVSKKLQGDRQVVLEAVKNRGDALKHASSKLRGKREVVMEAVKQCGDALRYASEELQGDLEIVVAAAGENEERAIWHAHIPGLAKTIDKGSSTCCLVLSLVGRHASLGDMFRLVRENPELGCVQE